MKTILDTEALKRAMDFKGFTAAQLGEKVGLSEHAIHQYSCGQRQPSVDVFFKICDVLGIKNTKSLVKKYEDTVPPTNKD